MDHTPRLRPAGLLGKVCHCSDCVSLYEMSVRGVAKGPEINDLWIASDCAWSHALVLPDLRKTTKERTVNGPDSIQFWMLPRRNCYLCVLCRPEYLSVTQFPLHSRMHTVNLHPGMTCV